MKDSTIRRVYDRGYEAGRQYATLGVKRSNPYQPASATRNRYYAGDSQYDIWQRGWDDGVRNLPRKLTQGEDYNRLFLFHHRVLAAFIAGTLRCDCAGISHDATCPLGELEVPAEEARQKMLDSAATKEGVTR